ncbi:2-phosphosulfolactate phosphatase [Candidatus Zixiibacteriota bacterium]
MEVQVFFSPGEINEDAVRGRTVVVIDVLRASTSIITAIHHGARGVIPAKSLEDATEMVSKLGMDDVLLCAEREMERVEGCDLGNSPAEYTRDRVEGRLLVLSTSNGSRAIVASQNARKVIIGGYVNASRVVEEIAKGDSVVIACAGHHGGFSLEDTACAGFLLHRLSETTGREILPLNDGAWVALELGKRTPKSPLRMIRRAAHSRRLEEAGYGGDLALCADVDSHPVLPVLKDHVIVHSDQVS